MIQLIKEQVVAISICFLCSSDFANHTMLNSTLRTFSVVITNTAAASVLVSLCACFSDKNTYR